MSNVTELAGKLEEKRRQQFQDKAIEAIADKIVQEMGDPASLPRILESWLQALADEIELEGANERESGMSSTLLARWGMLTVTVKLADNEGGK